MVAMSPSATALSKAATAERIVDSVAVNRLANPLSVLIRESTEGLVPGVGLPGVDEDWPMTHPVTPTRQHPQTSSRISVAINAI
jgi:hypothetical protein